MIGAQAELEGQISELRSSGADAAVLAEMSTQLSTLMALQGSVATAKPGALAALRAEIGSAVFAAVAVAQHARNVASAAGQDSPQLTATSVATRREVTELNKDLFERRIFDPYLKFSSTEEEEAYRRREAETKHYIEEQLAKKTPEGNLNAAGGTMGQMLDAHAHGAGESPEFLPRWNKLVETTRQHREAMRAEGRSTEEFDRNLVASVRRYLKDKGLTDAEIDAKLAVSNGDPLNAVRPYLKTEKDAQALEKPLQLSKWMEGVDTTEPVAHAVPSKAPGADSQEEQAPPTVEDVMTKFRAAGVVTSAQPADTGPSHGVGQLIARGGPSDGRGSPG